MRMKDDELYVRFKVKKDINLIFFQEYVSPDRFLRKIRLCDVEFIDNEILTLMSICRYFTQGRLFEKGGLGGVGYSLYFEFEEEDLPYDEEEAKKKKKPKVKNIYLLILKEGKSIKLSRLQSERIVYSIENFLKRERCKIDFYDMIRKR